MSRKTLGLEQRPRKYVVCRGAGGPKVPVKARKEIIKLLLDPARAQRIA